MLPAELFAINRSRSAQSAHLVGSGTAVAADKPGIFLQYGHNLGLARQAKLAHMRLMVFGICTEVVYYR